jgi:peptidoglycan L-alanyl-D-glutamate endopeptidase CwlK
MIISRKIEDLHPKVQAMAKAFLDKCRAEGIDVLITCTYRDNAAQDALYARGRTILTENGQKVRKVTNAKAGQSMHNYRLAFDCVPLRDGKPVWGTTGSDLLLWMRVGNIGEGVGLEWAGRWKSFREYPHFQLTGGHPLAYFQNGGKI